MEDWPGISQYTSTELTHSLLIVALHIVAVTLDSKMPRKATPEELSSAFSLVAKSLACHRLGIRDPVMASVLADVEPTVKKAKARKKKKAVSVSWDGKPEAEKSNVIQFVKKDSRTWPTIFDEDPPENAA
jgi:hypothetical protein